MLLISGHPVYINTISVKIDGIIDLGPDWNIKYNVKPAVENTHVEVRNDDKINYEVEKQPISSKNFEYGFLRQEVSVGSSSEDGIATIRGTVLEPTKKTTQKKKLGSLDSAHHDVKYDKVKTPPADTDVGSGETTTKSSVNSIDTEDITTPTIKPNEYTEKYIKDIYQAPRLVREDIKVQDFINDISQNSKRFFFEMKNKVADVRSKNKIDFLSRSYDEKFKEFLNDTQEQKILTRTGTQKVILNIIETSNTIIRRLFNYLLIDMQKKGALRNGAAGVLEGVLMNEEKQDYLNACEKFGICRSKDRFSLYAAEFLTEIISSDDDKIKLATGCFTELLKDADYGRFGDKKLKKQIVDTMEWIDQIQGKELRPLLITVKNMLVSKYKPLRVMPDAYGSAMNKSVAFLDLVDAIDESLPATENAINDWNESISAVREWVAGLRYDTLDILTKFSAHFLIDAPKRMTVQTAKKVKQSLKVLFKKPVEVER